MIKLFDTHCHLEDPAFIKDIDKVIDRIKFANVCAAMIVGTNIKRSKKAVDLATSNDIFFASVGFHPHDAKNCSEDSLNYMIKLAENHKVRAWGEIGLDFNRMYSTIKDQEKWFIRQLEIAYQLDLPIIFHERDTKGRFLEILKSYNQKKYNGVIHCFSGSPKELDAYLELGLHIGITGVITINKRGADLRKLARLIPPERILVETDAPYLTPAPEKNRIKRNEPAFVKSVLLKIAEVRQENPEYLANIIWENSCRLYNITDLK